MSYTKLQFIQGAFDEMGMADYVFDLSPEQLDRALRRLDAMMAEWNAKGIRLGYPLPVRPEDSVLSDDSYVPDSANEAIITNLAVRLAPGHGKTLSPDTKATAKLSLNTLTAIAVMPGEMALPTTLPSGAGNKGNPGTFIVETDDGVIDAPEPSVSFEGSP
jgi:hypothetical protein